jgi:hypothetical protein
MTAQGPADRPSAQEILSALRDGKRTVILPATHLRPASRLKRHGRTLLVAGIPAAAAVIAASATLVLQADVGTSPSRPVLSTPAAPVQASSTPSPGPAAAALAVEAPAPVTTTAPPPTPAPATTDNKVKKPKTQSNGNNNGNN